MLVVDWYSAGQVMTIIIMVMLIMTCIVSRQSSLNEVYLDNHNILKRALCFGQSPLPSVLTQSRLTGWCLLQQKTLHTKTLQITNQYATGYIQLN